MTENEAIEAIKSNRPTSGYVILNEALDMAINALEKQIPKKPIKDKYVPELDFCPECGTEVTYCNYCPLCGQKIDQGELE